MFIYRELWTDSYCQAIQKSIIRKIRMNAGLQDIYIISLAGGNDYFDLIHAANLKQKHFPKKDLYIMGFARGRDSAIMLANDMFLAFYKQYDSIEFKNEIMNEKQRLFRRW